MAIVWRRMSGPELAALTEAMLHSGNVLTSRNCPARKVDKHSTGGVGDKTSFIIAPIVAAAGLYVPMISGRGARSYRRHARQARIYPRLQRQPLAARIPPRARRGGCGIVGQSADIAPADNRLYALRDVTGTVESPYLICASIMSKKLAAGIDASRPRRQDRFGRVYEEEGRRHLPRRLMVETGEASGKRMVAAHHRYGSTASATLSATRSRSTRPSRPRETNGTGRPARTLPASCRLDVLSSPSVSKTVAEGYNSPRETIPGKAREKFRLSFELHGCPPRVMDDPKRSAASRSTGVDFTRLPGRFPRFHGLRPHRWRPTCARRQGASRTKIRVDPAVGLDPHAKLGDAGRARRSRSALSRRRRHRFPVPEEARPPLSLPMTAASAPMVHEMLTRDTLIHQIIRHRPLQFRTTLGRFTGILGLITLLRWRGLLHQSPRHPLEDRRLGARSADCLRALRPA